MSLRIGSLVLKNRFILSPMESVSDVGFRAVVHNNSKGAALTFTEMIRAQAVSRKNKSALDLIDTHDSNTPTGIQLMVKSADDLTKSLRQLETLAANGSRPHFKNIVAVDLNFGCPSPEVIREGAGPALLARRQKLTEIFKALVAWKHDNSLGNIGAVGCKIRLGLNQKQQNSKVYLSIVDIASATGLDYLVVHGRHAGQKSRDAPTWSAIREVKERALAQDMVNNRIPPNTATEPHGYRHLSLDDDLSDATEIHSSSVNLNPQVNQRANLHDNKVGNPLVIIGNGNVSTMLEATQMLQQTGCDGIMLARGAIRNPWIFQDLARMSQRSSDSSSDDQRERQQQQGDTFEDQQLNNREEYQPHDARYSDRGTSPVVVPTPSGPLPSLSPTSVPAPTVKHQSNGSKLMSKQTFSLNGHHRNTNIFAKVAASMNVTPKIVLKDCTRPRPPSIYSAHIPSSPKKPHTAATGARSPEDAMYKYVEYWPSREDVANAEKVYLNWVRLAQTKNKFHRFHTANFKRLKRIAETGDVTIKWQSPGTIHLS